MAWTYFHANPNEIDGCKRDITCIIKFTPGTTSPPTLPSRRPHHSHSPHSSHISHHSHISNITALAPVPTVTKVLKVPKVLKVLIRAYRLRAQPGFQIPDSTL